MRALIKNKFQKTIWDFYAKNKRQFPWRPPTLSLRRAKGELDPYRILVSEIMLQQTQVGRVVAKYEAFVRIFPNFRTLARASLRDVLVLWQGLGYNRRAIALKKIAEIVEEKYKGALPESVEELDELPGIGEATASSIMAFAWNHPTVFIETNIRRVFIHHFFKDKKKIRDEDILFLVEKTLPAKNFREWYYALMDYGAMLKTEVPNPNRMSAHYAIQSKFKGSNREVRGGILKFVADKRKTTLNELNELPFDVRMIEKNLEALVNEGFLRKNVETITIQ
ncbi:MAG: A/G-specific adenine glycosylase [Candidatus Taylorbacteria bacterium]